MCPSFVLSLVVTASLPPRGNEHATQLGPILSFPFVFFLLGFGFGLGGVVWGWFGGGMALGRRVTRLFRPSERPSTRLIMGLRVFLRLPIREIEPEFVFFNNEESGAVRS